MKEKTLVNLALLIIGMTTSSLLAYHKVDAVNLHFISGCFIGWGGMNLILVQFERDKS